MNEFDASEVEAMQGPAVTVEPGRRGGYGRGLRDQITLQLTEQTAQIVRIMNANDPRWSQADYLRDAVDGGGLASLAGYERAKREYDAGRRIAKAPASTRRAAGRGKRR